MSSYVLSSAELSGTLDNPSAFGGGAAERFHLGMTGIERAHNQVLLVGCWRERSVLNCYFSRTDLIDEERAIYIWYSPLDL